MATSKEGAHLMLIFLCNASNKLLFTTKFENK